MIILLPVLVVDLVQIRTELERSELKLQLVMMRQNNCSTLLPKG